MSHCLVLLKLFSDANLCNVITYHMISCSRVLFFQKTNEISVKDGSITLHARLSDLKRARIYSLNQCITSRKDVEVQQKNIIQTCPQGGNGNADIETRFVDTAGKEEGGMRGKCGTNGESSPEIYTLPSEKWEGQRKFAV